MSQGMSGNKGALDTLPVGSTIPYTGGDIPSGWMLCDGSAKSRTAFANLFNVIGTTFGVGDGSTTFNVPSFYSFGATPPSGGQLIGFDGTNLVGVTAGWKKLFSSTASSTATLDFTGLTGYTAFMAVLKNVVPVTTAQDLWVRASTNNGSSYDTTAANYIFNFTYSQGTGTTSGGIGDGGTSTAWKPALSVNNQAGTGVSGHLLFIPGITGTEYSRLSGQLTNYHSTNVLITSNFGCIYGVTTTPNALRFMFASGSVLSGTITIYGLP